MCFSSRTWDAGTVVWPSTTDLVFPGPGRVTAGGGTPAATRVQQLGLVFAGSDLQPMPCGWGRPPFPAPEQGQDPSARAANCCGSWEAKALGVDGEGAVKTLLLQLETGVTVRKPGHSTQV